MSKGIHRIKVSPKDRPMDIAAMDITKDMAKDITIMPITVVLINQKNVKVG